MPLDLTAVRSGPLDGLSLSGSVALTALPPAARYILRGRPRAIHAAGAAFGAALPQQACHAVVMQHGRAALWLGPDEWLLLALPADGPALAASLDHVMAGLPHSLVDVSHRQVAIEVAGPEAAAVLNAGCPLDLDETAFPVSMCTRTVLAKAEIVLWRVAPELFRVEVWRSFADYVWLFLEEASREHRAPG
jgi:sarcosine oxidase, subunit gamma